MNENANTALRFSFGIVLTLIKIGKMDDFEVI